MSDLKYYAGIGSRETPPDVLTLMEAIAARLAAEGWVLRSGHAQGADRAFERGAGGKATIYLPWGSFGKTRYKGDPGMPVLGEAVDLGGEVLEANYARLVSLGIRYKQVEGDQALAKLHGRNVAQVEGHGGRPFSRMVICWCIEVRGVPQGGTATAVMLARHHGIPVRNLWRDEDRSHAEAWLAE